MKHFKLNFKDGSTSYIKGNTISEAFYKAGYLGGAINALDYYEEVKELPIDNKEIVLKDGDKFIMASYNGIFHNSILNAIKISAEFAEVMNKKYKYIILPLQIICTNIS